MEYQSLKYLDPKILLIVKKNGCLMQLYVPIKAISVHPFNKKIPINTTTYIEEIRPHEKHKIIYRIFDTWYPYWGFRIS
jgi:hypothetical protein